ncbi:hypothetical protein D3C78_1850580 [compost metagenome]
MKEAGVVRDHVSSRFFVKFGEIFSANSIYAAFILGKDYLAKNFIPTRHLLTHKKARRTGLVSLNAAHAFCVATAVLFAE